MRPPPPTNPCLSHGLGKILIVVVSKVSWGLSLLLLPDVITQSGVARLPAIRDLNPSSSILPDISVHCESQMGVGWLLSFALFKVSSFPWVQLFVPLRRFELYFFFFFFLLLLLMSSDLLISWWWGSVKTGLLELAFFFSGEESAFWLARLATSMSNQFLFLLFFVLSLRVPQWGCGFLLFHGWITGGGVSLRWSLFYHVQRFFFTLSSLRKLLSSKCFCRIHFVRFFGLKVFPKMIHLFHIVLSYRKMWRSFLGYTFSFCLKCGFYF